ncbi:peptidoglycan-recognition protein LB-like isoform X2 [Hetaerina americana]
MEAGEVPAPTTTVDPFPIIPRRDWGARPPKEPPQPLVEVPTPYVVIHHTFIPKYCNSTEECVLAMREMQRFHQDDRGWNDIGYNFCIGGEGRIMEGRGWDAVGAHAPKYNTRSIGICLIGDFTASMPDAGMLEAAHHLIARGIDMGKISANYTLLGHRQVRDTECPGQTLYQAIQAWPHWGQPDPNDKKPKA